MAKRRSPQSNRDGEGEVPVESNGRAGDQVLDRTMQEIERWIPGGVLDASGLRADIDEYHTEHRRR